MLGHLREGGGIIRESLKQLLGLLIVGQLFLVATFLEGKKLPTPETAGKEGNVRAYVMQSSRELGKEPGNKGPEGDSSPVKNLVPGQLDMRHPGLGEKLRESAPLEGAGGSRQTSSGSGSGSSPSGVKVPETPVVVLGITWQDDAPIKTMEVDFSRPVQFIKINHEGKFLRIRLQPPVSNPPKPVLEEAKGRFENFSTFSGNTYSEWIIYGKGRLGSPYTATSSSGLPRLVIPYRGGDTGFPLTNGENLGQGAAYYRDRPMTRAGPSDAYILRADPLAGNLSFFPILANEGICQKEILSSMGRRYQALAAINGAYFTHRGDPIGTLIINRKLISSPLYNRSVFGISHHGLPMFGNPDFSGKLKAGDVVEEINAVNQPRKSGELVIYTPEYARSTLTTEAGIELILVKGRVVGIQTHEALIPPDGVVVSAGGEKARGLKGVRLGDMILLDYQVSSPWDRVAHAVCGGPRLLLDGEISIDGKEEKFDGTIVTGRHPRSAVGVTQNGDLLFVVVDGRSKRSAGMTLKELATYLQHLGVRNAINLDGGGSSSMLVRDRIVNHPSDGKERPITNGILITQK